MRVKVEVDEELWYGVSSDETAEAEAAKSMAARMGRIVGAKPFPAAAQRLSQLTQDPNCQMDDVVSVLESDPALSARLLRLVNSVGFSLRTSCTSVRHAAALVGTQKLNQVASTAAILDMYESGGERATQLLEHATVVGALCRYLAFHFGLPPDELFTCGFLHDIGKLMLLDTEGAAYLELLGPEIPDFDTTFVEERKRFGFDHALLAGHVLAAWNIPHPVPKVVAWHHHVTRAYAESTAISQMVSTLRLADAMSFAVSKPDIEVQIETLARMEAASYMDISEGQLAAMWEEVCALSQRARAVFRGEKVEDAQLAHTSRPSGASLRAVARAKSQDRVSMNRTSPNGVSAPPSSERTRQFPCVACGAPSYAQRCSACHGYMCPLHVAGEDEWCQLCRRDYEEAGIPAIRPIVSTVFGALAGALVAAAFFGAASAGAQQPLRIMVGPTLILMLLGMLAGVGQRWIRRWWFLRSRPSRASVVPKAVEPLLEAALHSPEIVELDSAAMASPTTENEGHSFRETEPSSAARAEQLRLMNPEIPSLPALPQLEVPNAPSPSSRSTPSRGRTWMSSRTPHPSAIADRPGSLTPPAQAAGARSQQASLEPRADQANLDEPTSLEPTSLEPTSLEPTSLEPTSLERRSLAALADEAASSEALPSQAPASEIASSEPVSSEPVSELAEALEGEAWWSEAVRSESMRAEADRADADRSESSRAGAEGIEAAPFEAAPFEAAPSDALRTEVERTEAEPSEALRDVEQTDPDPLDTLQTEAERAELEAELAEALRSQAERAEAERAEMAEALRFEVERAEAERAEMAEALRSEAERAEAERAEMAEALRSEVERAEAERAEMAEALRSEAERAETERAETERAETERAEAERAEVERAEVERAEMAEALRTEVERAEAEALRSEVMQSQAESAQAESAQAESAEVERTQADRTQADRTHADRTQADRTHADRTHAERAEVEALQSEPLESQADSSEAKHAEVLWSHERAEAERSQAEPSQAEPSEAERPSEQLPISEERVIKSADRLETELPAVQSAAAGGRPSSWANGSLRPPPREPWPLAVHSERPGAGANRASGPPRLSERSVPRPSSGAPSSVRRPWSSTPMISGAWPKSIAPAPEPLSARAASTPPRPMPSLSTTMFEAPAAAESRSAPGDRVPVPLHSRPAPVAPSLMPVASPPPSEPSSPRVEGASAEPRGPGSSRDSPLVPGEDAVAKAPKPAAAGDWSSVLEALDSGGGW